jgi:hypothetical protein
MSKDVEIKMQGGTVRVTLPARVANDLDTLQGALGRIAERMGHPACASGCDTLFLRLERDFGVSADALALNPQPLPPGLPEFGLPRDSNPQRFVEVSLPDGVSGNIDSLRRAVALTLNKLGCPSCCSGLDIAFRREMDLISISEDLEVRGFGRYR